MATEENEYYLRTILLLCEGGGYIAKQVIARELPKHGGDLDALLKRFENSLKHEFHKKQMEKLFPNNGFDKTDIDTWDIQMLIGVMLCLFRSTLSNEEKRKLREIKLIRHEVLAHSPTAALYKQKYEDVTDQLHQAINELASQFDQRVKDKCKKFITNYSSGPLDKQSAIQRLQVAKDTDDLFQNVNKIMKNTQAVLSKGLQEVQDDVKQDLKVARKKLSSELKSSEESITGRIRDTNETMSKGFHGIETDVKESKQYVSKGLEEIKSSIGIDLKDLRKKVKDINEDTGHTFKALTDLTSQIKASKH